MSGDDDDTNNHIDKDGEDDIIIMRYCIRDCVYLSELVSPGKFGNFQGVPSETLRLLKDGVKGIPRAHLHLGYLTYPQDIKPWVLPLGHIPPRTLTPELVPLGH